MGFWRSVAGREIVSLTFVEGMRNSSSFQIGFSGILVYVDNAMEMFGAGRDLPPSGGDDEHKVCDSERLPVDRVGEPLGFDARIPTVLDDAFPARENGLASVEISHSLENCFAPQKPYFG